MIENLAIPSNAVSCAVIVAKIATGECKPKKKNAIC